MSISFNSISGLMGNMLLSEMMKTSGQLMDVHQRLATGQRISTASDDAAGLAIATRLESQSRALAVAARNAQMGISKIQTAEGYLQSTTDDLQRIRELSVQAANGTLTDADRHAIQEEIAQLRENIDYTLGSAEFNSQRIFSGETETFQIGTDPSGHMTIDWPAMSAESLGLNEIDVTTQEGAEAAVSQSSDALDQVLSFRTELGAGQNRLESALDTISRTRIDTLSALSTIRDTNMVADIMEEAQAMTSLQSQVMLMSQINNLNRSIIPYLLGDND